MRPHLASIVLSIVVHTSCMMFSHGLYRRLTVQRWGSICLRCTQSVTAAGISEPLWKSLHSVGIRQLNKVQELSYPRIRKGDDVIVAAETGSGKTLAYMLPVLDTLIHRNALVNDSLPNAVVLAPTKELCRQIYDMNKGILSSLQQLGHHVRLGLYLGEKADLAAFASKFVPSVMVCTPRHLADLIRGPVNNQEEFFEAIKHVVLDEADMLLQGSYLNDVEKLLDAFKVIRRRFIREGRLKVHEKGVQFVLAAATLPSAGTQSVHSYVRQRFPKAVEVRTEAFHGHHPLIQQEFIPLEVPSGQVAPSIDSMRHGAHTMPEVGGVMHARIVAAAMVRLAGKLLSPPSDDELPSIVQQANSLDHQVMVFLNTAQSAQRMAASLSNLGVRCVEFHKLVSAEERQRNLSAYRAGDERVLVCTDSAGRGLDLPFVRHVIQAEFAENVVQHQHRVGRASRAGRAGRATSLYTAAAAALVESIRSASAPVQLTVLSAADDGRAGGSAGIERSFSRRRGFRKRMKRALKRVTEDEDYVRSPLPRCT